VSGLPTPREGGGSTAVGRYQIAARGTDGGEQRFDGRFPTAVPPQRTSNDRQTDTSGKMFGPASVHSGAGTATSSAKHRRAISNWPKSWPFEPVTSRFVAAVSTCGPYPRRAPASGTRTRSARGG
jgi:hypothetical protein